MKMIYFVPRMFFFAVLLLLIGCGKSDDGPTITDKENFYRLETFEVGVIPEIRNVQILFQVTDYDRNGVSHLTADDFIVRENGGLIDSEATLKIDKDSIPFTLKTVLLLDLSRSVEDFVGQIKNAAISMVNSKLPNQEIAIYTFDSNTELLQTFTTDGTALVNAINSIPATGLVNSTNLYGAVIDVAGLWEDSYSIHNIVDGSIIIFTDGRHNATPNLNLGDALDALEGKKVFVAALSSTDLDESSLKSLAGEERYFLAEDISILEDLFANIQTEITRLSNSIYYMFYQSPITDPTPHQNNLTIEVINNSNNGVDRKIEEKFNSAGFGN